MQFDFENLWRKDAGMLQKEIIMIWKQFDPSPEAGKAEERLRQLVYIVKNDFDQVIGISTAQKIYVKQLRNYLYSVRLLTIPTARQTGLESKLMVATRDFLESIHGQDGKDKCIGIIILVENKDDTEVIREAIWEVSQMIYIGNSGNGQQVRVYYFKGALIA
jgi:hypothetical protein